MKTLKAPSRRGQAVVEFTLAAIPMIFLLISIEEMARGMWIYNTLAHAIKEATRYGVVHGADCAQADSSCPVTLGQVVALIQKSGTGLDGSQLNVVLQTAGNTQTCAPLQSCLSNGTTWPPSPDNNVGLPITVSATYPFSSALSMLVPQVGAVRFSAVTFSATSREEIVY